MLDFVSIVMPAADGGRHEAGRLLAAGADLVALGRSFVANPDLVERMRTGTPVSPVRGKHLMYVGGAAGYTDYPVLAARYQARMPEPAAC